MVRRTLAAAVLAAAATLVASGPPARAQSPLPGGMPPPPGMSMPDYAARRFPQPVRVGMLVGEIVLRPVEAQDVLGTVAAVVRRPDGSLAVVVRYGGWFGLGARDIAVPVEAMALLGRVMEITGFTPMQLADFPTVGPDLGTSLPPDAIVHVGLAKPSH